MFSVLGLGCASEVCREEDRPVKGHQEDEQSWVDDRHAALQKHGHPQPLEHSGSGDKNFLVRLQRQDGQVTQHGLAILLKDLVLVHVCFC